MKMNAIELHIPAQSASKSGSVITNPRDMENWLDTLPLANPERSAIELVEYLYQLNRLKVACSKRYQIMLQFPPVVDSCAKALMKEANHATSSSRRFAAKRVVLLQRLMYEMAIGYKAIVVDLLKSQQKNEDGNDVLSYAIYYAIHYLGQCLLTSYLVYEPEPANVWLELHKLYLFSEQNGLHKVRLNIEENKNTVSIDHAYKYTLLLSLSSPYHLMQGEVVLAYDYIKSWAYHCKLRELDERGLTVGKLYIDLDTDAPPRYQSMNKSVIQPIEGRIIDIQELVDVINAYIEDLNSDTKEGKAAGSTLSLRMQRALYMRLAQVLGVRRERLSPRTTRLSAMQTAVGLSACHHFISGGQAFTPEQDEIQIRKQEKLKIKESRQLLLDTGNEATWEEDEQESRLSSGIYKPRTSKFSSVEQKNEDIWHKIYATSLQRIDTRDDTTSAEENYTTIRTRLINISQGGVQLRCNESDTSFKVGDLVTFRPSDNDEQDWGIGSVRWIQNNQNQELEMGVGVLSEDALAVATKVLKGTGEGGEYFRALLMPKMNPLEYPTTLLTHAAIYDVNSILVINMKYQLLFVRLTQLIETTASCSRFRFVIVDDPRKNKSEKKSYRIEKSLR